MSYAVNLSAGLLCLLMVAFTALPIVKTSRWWIRALDFPRLQIAFLLAFALTIYVLSAPSAHPLFLSVVAVSVAALFWQAWLIAPYTRLWRVQMRAVTKVQSDRTLRLLMANVLQDNKKSSALLKLVENVDADLLLLTEIDEGWIERLSSIRERYTQSILKPLSNTYGMALYSRLALENAEVRYLLDEDIPSIRVIASMKDGTRLALWVVHPSPPRPGDDTQERDAELLLVAKEAADSAYPAIVAGDLNDVAWSRTTALFQKISGLLDPRVGRGFYATFNADWPLLKWPLDHLFASSHWTLVDFRRLDHIGSDHFPVLAILQIEPLMVDSQEPDTAEASDVMEAERLIEKGREKSD